MKMSSVSFIILVVSILSNFGEAREFERPLRRGQGSHRRGNENSQTITQVQIGTASYAGTGCPAGSMRVIFAPDFLSFTILFDQFIAEVKEGVRGKRDNMSCDSLIPIRVPEGMQMEITRVDFRGFALLPDRSRALLHSIFNFRGQGGDGDRLNLRYQFQGPLTEDFTLSSDANAGGNSEISPCGGRFQLRILNQLQVISQARGSAASLALDTIDGSSQAIYYVNWRSCQKQLRPRIR